MLIGYCTSCGGNVTTEMHYSKFKCPNCKQTIILRCEVCKEHGNEYKCESCGFVGP